MITRYECPIPGCGWFHYRPNPETTAVDSAGDYMNADRVIDAHSSAHPPSQWAAELARSNQRATSAERRAEQAERDLDAIIGAWRNLRDFDEATRIFNAFVGAAGIDAGDIKTRLLAAAREMQEASAQ